MDKKKGSSIFLYLFHNHSEQRMYIPSNPPTRLNSQIKALQLRLQLRILSMWVELAYDINPLTALQNIYNIMRCSSKAAGKREGHGLAGRLLF